VRREKKEKDWAMKMKSRVNSGIGEKKNRPYSKAEATPPSKDLPIGERRPIKEGTFEERSKRVFQRIEKVL